MCPLQDEDCALVIRMVSDWILLTLYLKFNSNLCMKTWLSLFFSVVHIILCIWCFTYMCVCTMPCAYRSQKRAWEPSWTGVTYSCDHNFVGPKNPIWFFWISSWAISPSPPVYIRTTLSWFSFHHVSRNRTQIIRLAWQNTFIHLALLLALITHNSLLQCLCFLHVFRICAAEVCCVFKTGSLVAWASL